MDVLVLWDDHTKNVVSSDELVIVSKKQRKFKEGIKVKMFYEKKCFLGTVLACEKDSDSNSDSSSTEDNVPLFHLQKKLKKEEAVTQPIYGKTALDEVHFNESNETTQINISKTDEKIVINKPVRSTRFAKSYNLESNDNLGENDDFMYCAFGSGDDSDKDPHYVNMCSVKACKKEGIYICDYCEIAECEKHFKKTCSEHISIKNILTDNSHEEILSKKKKSVLQGNMNRTAEVNAASLVSSQLNKDENIPRVQICEAKIPVQCREPEEFTVEGSGKEIETRKMEKEPIYKTIKRLRQSGQSYIMPKTMNLVPPKALRSACKGDTCRKSGKMCYAFKEEERQKLLNAYYSLGNIQLQREYINRHINRDDKKQKTTKNEESRRTFSNKYFLPQNNVRVQVCKKFFLNTLAISEKVMRNSILKLNSTGVVEKDNRGGRHESMRGKDKIVRQAMQNHLNRFPRVESHYCRQSSSREYLHSDLTIPIMHSMYLKSCSKSEEGSIDTYRRIFKEMNLSIHRPKKDLCSLCMTYNEGDAIRKMELEETYQEHIERKQNIRKIKQECKEKSIADKSFLSAVFDLQQVIYLPKTNESAVFYKRRLAAYNFTLYNLASKDCFCFTWSEIDGKRGSTEISTCIYKFLQFYDDNGIKSVALFADGCSGQNKNSIVASMLLYVVINSKNIEQICLKFFEPFHGQNEGDSVHSTIGTAISQSGDLFVPSQLIPIFRLARRKQPYTVIQMDYSDFLDFKTLSKDLRILCVRQDDNKNNINWTTMCEFKVEKEHPNNIFFKVSHCDEMYSSITLKRQNNYHIINAPLSKLNKERPKITHLKYKDLVSLCTGKTPIIRSQEHISFYKSLPRE